MADVRELFESQHELMETLRDATRAMVRGGYPVQVSVDTDHGHIAHLQPMVKFQYVTPEGETKTEEMTQFKDVPIRFQRGGGVVVTHPVKKGDIGWWQPMPRDFSLVMEKDGVQDPSTSRSTSLSDGYFTSGFRPDPQDEKVMGKEGKRFSKDSRQSRSDDGKHVRDIHPGDPTGKDEEKVKKGGFTDKSVDKDDEEKDNPYGAAKTFYERTTLGNVAIQRRAVKDSNGKPVQHEITTTHSDGHKTGVGDEDGVRKHYTDLHPEDGYKTAVERDKHHHTITGSGGHSLSANEGKQSVTINDGKVVSKADQEVTHDAPTTRSTADHLVDGLLHAKGNITSDKVIQGAQGLFGMLSGLMGGAMQSGGGANSGIGAGAMQNDAASENVGPLSYDLSGMLPEAHVRGARDILGFNFQSDAEAGQAGVQVGEFYHTDGWVRIRLL